MRAGRARGWPQLPLMLRSPRKISQRLVASSPVAPLQMVKKKARPSGVKLPVPNPPSAMTGKPGGTVALDQMPAWRRLR